MKVTIIQTDLVWENIDENLLNFTKKINEISEETNLIILPEMFATGFSMTPEKFAEKQGGKIFLWLKNQAKAKKCTIIGSIITEENSKYYNRLIFMKADGSFSHYDKRHLFSFAGEDKYYSAGNQHLIEKIQDWKIRPLICYDLRFPVWSRNKNDYDLLIYIANWPERRANAWKTLLQARAIENQCFVIGVNRIGNDGNGIYHSGDSMIIAPKGNIISKTKAHEESVETLFLNLKELQTFREKFAVSKDADKFDIKLK